jgi:hypothetical protein
MIMACKVKRLPSGSESRMSRSSSTISAAPVQAQPMFEDAGGRTLISFSQVFESDAEFAHATQYSPAAN